MLFAQINRANPANPFGAGGPFAGTDFMLIILGVCGCMFVLYLAVFVPFCMITSRALSQVARKNRLLEPSSAWFTMIPIWSQFYAIVVAIETVASLRSEFKDRGMHRSGEDYGRGLWIMMMAIPSGGYILGIIPLIGPFLFLIALVVALVFFVMFLVRISGHARELEHDDFDRRDNLETDDYRESE